jgi:hypothetical protein
MRELKTIGEFIKELKKLPQDAYMFIDENHEVVYIEKEDLTEAEIGFLEQENTKSGIKSTKER